MKHMRILIFVLALALLCAGCASGGTAEATPAPDMSDLPLDGGSLINFTEDTVP